LLLNVRGLDITALFESYHPFTERPWARLASFTPVSDITANGNVDRMLETARITVHSR
jgi:hypothetical protein